MDRRLFAVVLALVAAACADYDEGESFEVDGGTAGDGAVLAESGPAVGDAGIPLEAGGDAGAPAFDQNLHYAPTDTWSPASARVVGHAKAVLARGAMRTDVFAKVGDSNTVNTNYLGCLEGSGVTWGSSSSLMPTVAAFSKTKVDGTKASFARTPLAAGVGWGTRKLTTGTPSPLDQEIEAIQPGFAMVMLGTNDTTETGIWPFPAALLAVTARLEQRGVLPILSTIPPRKDSAAMASLAQEMNAVVRALAEARRLPLVDVWRMVDPLGHALVADGIHLNVGAGGGCNFQASGLDYGMTMRNLVTTTALDRARRFFLANEAPDSEPPALSGEGTFAAPLVVDRFPFTDARDSRVLRRGTRDRYGCANQSEGGNEIVYRLHRTKAARVNIRVFSLDGADHDLQLLTADGAETCILRDDKLLTVDLPVGDTLLVVDAFGPVGTAKDGEFLLTVVETL
jgi:hypothetical protein